MFGAAAPRNGIKATIQKVISELGYDPLDTIAGAKINHKLYSDPDFPVPTSMFCQIFAHCAKVMGCPDFGLLIGAEGTLSWLGRIGFVAQHANDVATALQNIGAYFHHYDRSAVVSFKKSNESVFLGYAPLVEMEGQDQWLRGVMSCAVSFMRELCGGSWVPREVTFAVRPPANTRLYDDFFHAKLTFDATETAVLFDPAWLAHRPRNANPELHKLLLNDVEREEYADPPDSSLELLRAVRSLIGTGQCSTAKISALLGIPIRTLYDRFSQQGKTFRQVVDEVRFEIAKQLMRHTTLSLREISDRLDYSEISAFTRAFRRWSGVSPGNWHGDNGV